MASESLMGGTGLESGVFNAAQSFVIWEDDKVIISWNQSHKQPVYTIKPGSSIGWHDISVIKINGNSKNLIAESGDVSANEGTFYFSDNGTRKAKYDLENYGARSMYSLSKESFDSSARGYFLDIAIGNTGSGMYTIKVLNHD